MTSCGNDACECHNPTPPTEPKVWVRWEQLTRSGWKTQGMGFSEEGQRPASARLVMMTIASSHPDIFRAVRIEGRSADAASS